MVNLRTFLICLLLLSTAKIFAATQAEEHIAKARVYIASIKNYNAHKNRLSNITNNRPAGKPGTTTKYITNQSKVLNSKIRDAKALALNEFMAAAAVAKPQEKQNIRQLKNELDTL